ncbi:MAG TPA: carboxypeptidase regulatory-like domain-containing protein, partial [Vicinamibacterales bacterium]
ARSEVLPGPRMAVSGQTGDYRLPQLPPGNYTLTFTLAGMQATTRQAQVLLAQDVVANASLSLQGVAEAVTVTAEASLIDKDSATLKSGLTSDQIRALPVGQEYRDIIKLIPGVQYSQDTVRGPSAGGSGQDNVYQFDGVNVTLPLFGTLSAEPASHDIAQVNAVKGGARAVDFDRSGGFSIDSVSKSGTSRYSGMASFQFQSSAMAADVKSGTRSRYEQDRAWTTLNAGGPIVRDRLFFYGSYYRPTNSRDNQANDYGDLPKYESTRNEGFGKLTFTPLNTVLVNVSYRDSHRLETGDVFAQSASATSGTGNEAWLKIATVDGSWLVDSRSFLTFKYTHFANETLARPDFLADVSVSSAPGTRLNTSSLNTQGRFTVPAVIAGQDAYNAFIQPLVNQYGYVNSSGVMVGGGVNGYGLDLTADDFFRDAGQVGYNISFNGPVSHEVHVGYQRYTDSEDLQRTSNGWGLITVPGGRTSFQGTPIFYTATYAQQSGGNIPPIHSEYRSHSFEFNDTIRWKNLSINAGLLLSNDSLYGQDLKNDDSTLSGFVYSAGSEYKMYEIPFSKMVQPRIGVTWAYNGSDTVYGSYAKYNPAASSLPRAASWARNRTTTVDAHFDATGLIFATTAVASSSGKLFVEDMTPRTINEVLFGTARQLGRNLTGRAYGRYREGSHF